MLIIVLIGLVMLVFIDKLLRDRKRFIEKHTAFKINQIRDELFIKVMDDEQPDNDNYRAFETMSLVIRDTLGSTLIWIIALFMLLKDSNDKDTQEVQKEFAESENRELAKALIEFTEVMHGYVRHRHPFLLICVRNTYNLVNKVEYASSKMSGLFNFPNNQGGFFGHSNGAKKPA
jgi:hypothetical protein